MSNIVTANTWYITYFCNSAMQCCNGLAKPEGDRFRFYFFAYPC